MKKFTSADVVVWSDYYIGLTDKGKCDILISSKERGTHSMTTIVRYINVHGEVTERAISLLEPMKAILTALKRFFTSCGSLNRFPMIGGTTCITMASLLSAIMAQMTVLCVSIL